MTKIAEIVQALEEWAPPSYQEVYDNSGLLCGDPSAHVKGILISLDCVESIVDEAIERGCNLIVAHHPIIFKGIKSLTGKNYVERTVIKAIKNDISIYAIHTNLDNIDTGVNQKLANKIGLKNLQILQPKVQMLEKLTTFIPKTETQKVLQALYHAGGGNIGNYSGCSFRVTGTGTFTPNEHANPTIGEALKQEEVIEDRVEIIYPADRRNRVLRALKDSHPYEEVAYYQQALLNQWQNVGAGMIGELPEAVSSEDFLRHLKEQLNTGCIRFTNFDRPIKLVAICGGSGSFLISAAKAVRADAFITGDLKYHEFFDAEGELLLADVGHYESEFYTIELISDFITQRFRNIAPCLTKQSTNPINYFH